MLQTKLSKNLFKPKTGPNSMKWTGKRVLVTGAEGFIGSHLTEALVREGAEVTALVRSNFQGDCGFIESFSPEMKRKIKIYFGDLMDIESIYNAVRGNEIVFNLAAEISIPYSYVHPRSFLHTNVVGTFNILMACKDLKVSNLVHMSTSEVYGTPQTVPIKETHPLIGQSPYSATKISAEKIAESFYRSYNVPVTIVRAFNTYGPRQSDRAIIPTLITQALFHDTISVGNLVPTRDLNFVTDTVSGLMRVAETKSLIGEVVNIGSGREISIGNLLKKIVLLTDTKAKLVQDPKRLRPEKSEVMRLCADTTKLRKSTGWQPQVTLDEGLKKTIAWIRMNKKRYKIGEYKI